MSKIYALLQSEKKLVLIIALSVLVFAVLAVFLLVSRDVEDGFEYLIGLSQPNLSDNAQKALYNDMVSRCSQFPDIRLVAYDAGFSSAKQRGDIDKLLEMDVDVIVVVTQKPEEIVDSISRAYDAGTDIIVVGYAPMNGKYTTRIFVDNNAVANIAGEYVNSISNGEPCTVLEIQGEPRSKTSQDLKDGFLEAISRYGHINKEYVMTGYWSQVRTKERMEESGFLSKPLNLNVIFTHNDSMAIAASMTAEKYKYNLNIIGIGGYAVRNGDLQAIMDGKIDATVYCPTGGGEAVDTAVELFRNNAVPRDIELTPGLITRDNVDMYAPHTGGFQ